jgi:outer membrane lipase/esterase
MLPSCIGVRFRSGLSCRPGIRPTREAGDVAEVFTEGGSSMRTTLRGLCGVLFACIACPAFAVPFTGLYFFGDSLTDTGNVTEVYATVPKPPGAPAVVPGPPYDPGGRASNGPLYADVLAAGLGSNALAAARGGNNFAFGGARTRYQIFGPPFLGIIDQVAAFRARPGPADSGALYVLWAGSNNLQDIFLGRTTDVFGNPIPGLAGTLGDIAGMIQNLYEEGARNLFLPNVANLGRVPRLRELGGPPAQAAATAFVQAYNDAFATMLDAVQDALPDINIIRFDSFAEMENIVINAPDFGLTNVTDRCYTGDDVGFTGGGTVCAEPDEYFFWDGIHPTAVAHGLIGERMLAAVAAAAVPEPPLLSLLALPLLGWLAIRRRDARAGTEQTKERQPQAPRGDALTHRVARS